MWWLFGSCWNLWEIGKLLLYHVLILNNIASRLPLNRMGIEIETFSTFTNWLHKISIEFLNALNAVHYTILKSTEIYLEKKSKHSSSYGVVAVVEMSLPVHYLHYNRHCCLARSFIVKIMYQKTCHLVPIIVVPKNIFLDALYIISRQAVRLVNCNNTILCC